MSAKLAIGNLNTSLPSLLVEVVPEYGAALRPKTGEMVTRGIEAAAGRVFDNLEAVLKTEGLSLADVVKATVYLTKPEDFPALNAVYARRMGDSRPARSTVFLAGLPKGAPIEVDVIARTK